MKKRVILLLALVLLPVLLLSSCGDKGGTTPPAAEPQALAELSSYTIVYPYEPGTELFRAILALREAIRKETGVTLSVKDDFLPVGTSAPTGTREILIGITNRPESRSQGLRRDESGIYFENGRLVIAGGTEKMTVQALEKFCETYLHDGAVYAPGAPDLVRASYPYENATLGGVPISEFVIVRDTRNAAMAGYLRDRIADATGFYLPTVMERDTASAHKIYIGGRASGMTAPTAGEYRIEWRDGSLALYGTDSAAACEATVAFASRFAGEGATLEIAYPTAVTGPAAPRTFYTLNLPATLADMSGKYDPIYSAETVMDRFFAAKAELPEEVTVVEPVSLSAYPMSAATAVYVAPGGVDSNDGTKESPLATITEALSRIRESGSGVIFLREGTYTLENTLKLDATIKSTAELPFFLKAYEDEEVVLTSNRTVDTSDGKWHYLDPAENGELYDRIPETARDNIVYTTLAEQGWTEADIPKITKETGAPSLFVDGEEYTLAQYPNKTIDPYELLYFTSVYDSGTVTSRDGSNLYWPWVERATAAGKDPKTWIVGWEIRIPTEDERGQEITNWVNTGDIWYYGSTFEGWEFAYYNLALETEGQAWAHNADGSAWVPGSGETPYVGYPKGDGKYSLKSIQPNSFGAKHSANSAAGRNTFYLFNAAEALDAPGEWFYDKESGCLFLYPEEDHETLSQSRVTMSASSLYHLIMIENTSHIVLDGLTIDGVNQRGLHANKSSDIIIQNCTFRNTALYNASFNDCRNTAILYSDFSRGGSGLVAFSGSQSSLSLTPTNNVVQNCVFHDPMPLTQVALSWGGCRMVVSHNYFNNTTAHGSNAVECILEYNRFEGGSKDVTDGGMIYSGGAFSRGNHYRYNLIHMFNATHQAVYNDGQGSGNYMYYNIVSTIHSRSNTNKAWYSSSGWGNVCYGNLTFLRTPGEVLAAGSNSSIESDNTIFQDPSKGDSFGESALFYYYFGDQYSAGGAAARYQPVDYEGNKQLDFTVIDTDGKVKLGSQPMLSQSLAGHWWVGNKTKEVQNYITNGNLASWFRRAPEYANTLCGTQLILSLYEATSAGTEDYHPKYFYMPWYLTGKTYTYTGLPAEAELLIPQYSYLEKVGNDTYLRTEEAHVAERNADGSVTLTYEEVAAMERSRRAPQYSVVTDNVIFGGTPIYRSEGGKYVSTGEVDRRYIITDDPEANRYRGYVATSYKTANFMHYDTDELLPFLRYDFDYTVPADVWSYIADAGVDDPALTPSEEALAALRKVDYTKAGPTYEFPYEDWFDAVYPDFD
ncbi:MAG: right-handed parallel beta-helix repeat-containing protein [Clostridia bacterium]|nr:right-handed parallel beta-helix repeat-containing protein [Clostridia bacterium]